MSGKRRGGLAAMVNALPDLATAPSSEPEAPKPGPVVEAVRDIPAESSPAQDATTATAEVEPSQTTPESPQDDETSTAPVPVEPSQQKAARPVNGARQATRRRTPPVAAVDPKAAEPTAGPRYLQFEPKTVRMTADQFDALQRLERTLRRKAGPRQRGDELITANALVRIGIDLVLREAEALSGATEADLRSSVGLGPLSL
jgi:hypothetical protein